MNVGRIAVCAALLFVLPSVAYSQETPSPSSSAAPESTASPETSMPEATATPETSMPEASATPMSPAPTTVPASPSTATQPMVAGSVNIPTDGKWHSSVTPYLWLPAINGIFQFQRTSLINGQPIPVTINSQVTPGSYFSHINGGALASFETRKNEAAFFGDFIWLNLSAQNGTVKSVVGPGGRVEFPVNVNGGGRVKSIIWTIGTSGTVVHNDNFTLDVLFGVRSAWISSQANWNFAGPLDILPISGSIEKSGSTADVFTGIRGKLRLGSRFFLPYYGDAGWGTGSSTWQAYSGIGYEENWGNVVLVWRNLAYNTDSTVQKLNFGGAALGFTIKL